MFRDKRQLFTFFIIYSCVLLLLHQWFNSKQAPTRAYSAAAIAQEARRLEAEGADPKISLADRLKKYQGASEKYHEIVNHDGSKPDAIDARYQILRVLSTSADLEKESTGYYDQAENLLKDMEAHLAGKSAGVVLTPGKPAVRIADVGVDASARLARVREDRDRIYRHNVLYVLMNTLVQMTGSRPDFSYWFALVALTVVLKTLLWPLSKKQYRYMQDMQRTAPLLKAAQEKMKGRPQEETQRAMMSLYKEHNINPASGCLPMILQMVVLIPVYHMVRLYEFQFSKGYFLWIGSEWSHRWPMWLGKNLASFDVPMFALYLGSTLLFSLLQPPPADPQQAQQQKIMMIFMPVIFGVMMWFNRWSSAFMFYWLVQNLVSLWQTWRLKSRYPTLRPALSAADGGGVIPPSEPLRPMSATGNGQRPGGGSGGSARKRRKKKKDPA